MAVVVAAAAGEAKMEKLEFIRVEDGLAGLTA